MVKESQNLNFWPIYDSYSIARVDQIPEDEYLRLFKEHMLQGYPVLPWRSSLDENQKQNHSRLKALVKDKFELRLVLKHRKQMIGWTHGWQDSVHASDYYMGSSLVLPEHRRRGLYGQLIQKTLEITEAEGFSAVRSRHICTNNAVLIAKLKIGFTINGFEQDDTMGSLVRMIYHHNDLRRKATLFRAGKIDEVEVLKKLSNPTTH
jgi:hypothetical protein